MNAFILAGIALALIGIFVVLRTRASAKFETTKNYKWEERSGWWKSGIWTTFWLWLFIFFIAPTATILLTHSYNLDNGYDVKESKVERIVSVGEYEGNDTLKYMFELENGETIFALKDEIILKNSEEESTVRYGTRRGSWGNWLPMGDWDTGNQLVEFTPGK